MESRGIPSVHRCVLEHKIGFACYEISVTWRPIPRAVFFDQKSLYMRCHALVSAERGIQLIHVFPMKYIVSIRQSNHAAQYPKQLLKRNETGRVSGTNTRPSVLDGLAGKC